jgi:hypothetical protein
LHPHIRKWIPPESIKVRFTCGFLDKEPAGIWRFGLQLSIHPLKISINRVDLIEPQIANAARNCYWKRESLKRGGRRGKLTKIDIEQRAGPSKSLS